MKKTAVINRKSLAKTHSKTVHSAAKSIGTFHIPLLPSIPFARPHIHILATSVGQPKVIKRFAMISRRINHSKICWEYIATILQTISIHRNAIFLSSPRPLNMRLFYFDEILCIASSPNDLCMRWGESFAKHCCDAIRFIIWLYPLNSTVEWETERLRKREWCGSLWLRRTGELVLTPHGWLLRGKYLTIVVWLMHRLRQTGFWCQNIAVILFIRRRYL